MRKEDKLIVFTKHAKRRAIERLGLDRREVSRKLHWLLGFAKEIPAKELPSWFAAVPDLGTRPTKFLLANYRAIEVILIIVRQGERELLVSVVTKELPSSGKPRHDRPPTRPEGGSLFTNPWLPPREVPDGNGELRAFPGRPVLAFPQEEQQGMTREGKTGISACCPTAPPDSGQAGRLADTLSASAT